MLFSRLCLIAVLAVAWTKPTDSFAGDGLHPGISGKPEIVPEQAGSDDLKKNDSSLTHGPEVRVSSGISYAMWKDEHLGIGLPHITRFPDAGVMTKVNEELGLELQNRREMVADCLDTTDGGGRSWDEQVSVSLFTPDILSIVRRSDYYCGGAHPDTALEPLVYDLHTGKTLDLKNVFKVQQESAPLTDGTVPDGPGHALLLQLFLRHFKPQEGCADVIGSDTTLKIFFTERGLTIASELGHAVQACGDEILIPYSELRAHLRSDWRFASR
jgi:hypothetical protein